MTATVENAHAGTGKTGVGRVARVIGPVVDVEFGVDDLPEIYNALTVDVDFGTASDEGVEGDSKHQLTLEVAQHIGDNLIRAIFHDPISGNIQWREIEAAALRCRSRYSKSGFC